MFGINLIRLNIALFLALVLAGCNLSKEHHLQLINDEAGSQDSACGYFDNGITFGDENESQITIGQSEVEFCSIEYEFKIVAQGFVVPLYPVDGYGKTENIRWVRVKNRGSMPISLSGKTDSVKADPNGYPNDSALALHLLNREATILEQYQYIWVGFPFDVPAELDISVLNESSTVTFGEGTALDWYMITH